ncbi:GUN4 domain-containing protein, partial [Microcoleus sp. herbarium14]|uniref:GUN4 domain-containing protein n=1 Tax=Microcoleus sp. herbarium14 TaxID=3055439 RepID=UPI002FD77070
FPCEDLRTIDQLWVKYSNGRFGFSVQKRIYHSLGTRKFEHKIWEAFGDRVGWRVNSEWLGKRDLKYNSKAPEGHLPVGDMDVDGWGWKDEGDNERIKVGMSFLELQFLWRRLDKSVSI